MSNFLEKNFPTFTRANKTSANKKAAKTKPPKNSGGPTKPVADQTTAVVRKDYKPAASVLPQVNLLPPLLVFRMQRRRLRFGFLMASIVVVALAAIFGLYMRANANIETVNTKNLQKNTAATQETINRFGPIGGYVTAIEQRQQFANTLTANKVNYSAVYTSLAAALPAGSTYTDTTFTPNTAKVDDTNANKAFVAACGQTTDPFNPSVAPVAACIKLTGTAPSTSINTIVQRLRNNPLFSNVYLTQSSGANGTVATFQGSVNVNRNVGGN